MTRFEVPTGLFKKGWGSGNFLIDSDFQVEIRKTTVDTHETFSTIPIGQIVQEYQKSAFVAQEQLRQDVACIDADNQVIRGNNEAITEVLSGITGLPLPPNPEAWMTWWKDQLGYPDVDSPPPFKPTVFENVPLAYLPQPIGSSTRIGKVLSSQDTYQAGALITQSGLHRMSLYHLHWECFAAGTPVRTRLGLKPIESMEVGDQVLSQDTTTGKLDYRPVVAVFKFRPADTLKLQLGSETISTTGVHRFWKPGEGWKMARDLKSGDTVRTLGGTVRVGAILPDQVRHTFNLEVADAPNYFVGQQGLLVHDNTDIGPRQARFDVLPAAGK